jgi:hypothetical protein
MLVASIVFTNVFSHHDFKDGAEDEYGAVPVDVPSDPVHGSPGVPGVNRARAPSMARVAVDM